MLLTDRRVWFTPLMFVLVLAGTRAEGRAQETAGSGPQDAIRNCMKQDPGAARAVCWDDAIRNFLGNGTTKQALALLQGLAKDDPFIRLAGHPIAHAIGRETTANAIYTFSFPEAWETFAPMTAPPYIAPRGRGRGGRGRGTAPQD